MTKPTLWLTCVLCMLCFSARLAVAQIEAGPADPPRWGEQAYGMSLTPPPGSVKTEQNADGALVQFLTPDNFTLSIYIRKSNSPMDLPMVKRKALKEFAFLHPSSVPVKQDRDPISIAGRKGIGLYMLTPDKKQGDWVFAQAFMLIDPTTLAIFQLDCDAIDLDQANSTFKKLLSSVSLADPAELDKARTQRLQRMQAWLVTIDPEQIKSAIASEQLLRIVQGGKDVGFKRIEYFDEADHVPPGNSINVRSRFEAGSHHYDTEASYFETDDRSVEFWTITTTLRPAKEVAISPDTPTGPTTQNWRQTGLRDGDRIEVSQETPSRIQKFPWTKPPAVYLSQVDLFTLPALLPHDQPGEFSFYAFNEIALKLSLRTLRVEPLPDGGYRIYDRPTPDQAEQVSTYDREGKLLERKMPDGKTYIQTTPQELKRIWDKF